MPPDLDNLNVTPGKRPAIPYYRPFLNDETRPPNAAKHEAERRKHWKTLWRFSKMTLVMRIYSGS